jgi:Arc/MetJ-type ribon-helix-helix transcriptional regulator
MDKDHSNDNPSQETREKKLQSKLEDLGSQVENLAAKTAESIKRSADKALASRNTVLTIRVTDDCNRKLNMLVDAGLFKSRSESAAFLIEQGIRSQDVLFSKIISKLDKIDKIKEELKTIVSEEISQTKKSG